MINIIIKTNKKTDWIFIRQNYSVIIEGKINGKRTNGTSFFKDIFHQTGLLHTNNSSRK